MMKLSRKELQDTADEPNQPEALEAKKGMTPEQKRILEKTMRRHDEAFKKLAAM